MSRARYVGLATALALAYLLGFAGNVQAPVYLLVLTATVLLVDRRRTQRLRSECSHAVGEW